ncbi:cytochrome B5 isoform A [Perilla frutescens var. frutescens]|nr:cytochrome B5 isoform A [Perilla frutescens var. frutescens]
MPTLTKLYTMEEASQHNTNEDCWIVIDGKVYDVSSYLDEHPGGDDVLLGATGKDATDEFEDAGHSKSARELMDKFCIGELDVETTPIPELEIISKKQEVKGLLQKILYFSKQYWFAPVTVVGLSVVVGYLYLRKK